MLKLTKMYLHGSKESNYCVGRKLKLKGEALENFEYALYEVEFDVEVQYKAEWLEVSSISNMGDNQSKPANIRYKPKDGGKNIKVHMLNGSGVALPRLLLALQKGELNDTNV